VDEEEDDNDTAAKQEEELQRELEAAAAVAEVAAANDNLNMIHDQINQESQLIHNYEIFNHLPKFVPCFDLLKCAYVLPCTTAVLTNVQIANWCCPLHDVKALFPSLQDPNNRKESSVGVTEEKSMETDIAESTVEVAQQSADSTDTEVVNSSSNRNKKELLSNKSGN